MRVVRALKAIRAARDVNPDDLARAAGMARATYFKRMTDGQFTIGQVIALADFLGVPVQDLVDGKVTLTKAARTFALVNGEGRGSTPATPLLNPLPSPAHIGRNYPFTRR